MLFVLNARLLPNTHTLTHTYTQQNRALAKMELKDYDGALLAIQASCNLSRNLDCSESLAVLAKVYQYKNDLPGELQALTNLLQQQPQPQQQPNEDNNNYNTKAGNFKLQNERRLAELRLQKLTFLMNKNNNKKKS